MSWSGGGSTRRPEPVFRVRKGGGCTGRTLAWIILAIIVLSQCNARAVTGTNCFMLESTRQYIDTLYVPDESGQPDMDYLNDYLADVPEYCQPIVEGYGRRVASAYRR